jgi:hypothetical protein
MTTVAMMNLPRSMLTEFDWIVGPVYAADVARDHDIAVVYQGPGAYAVVRPSMQSYVACCPTERKALQLVEALVEAISST